MLRIHNSGDFLDNVKAFCDQGRYGMWWIFRKCHVHPIRHDGVEGQAMVTKQSPQTIDRRGFHFEIRDTMWPEPESGELIVQIRIFQGKPQDTSLWSIESWTGGCDAFMVFRSKML